uniref:28S ribosomal protein S34, mitochondrial n=1 Tax=Syphacia muris TaxID=451379 RepID=A0A0N5AEU2_9BILA
MAKAIRFIGDYDFTAEGKFLWEILTQVRNFGVGRIVTKNEWSRKWPKQPSYIKVIKAQPEMDRWLQRGKIWGEWTFRGRHLGIFEFSSDLNRSDWRLIHKKEEEEFVKCDRPMGEIKLPNSFPLPPLQIYLAKKQAKLKGIENKEVPERASLSICLDPEFSCLKPFIKKVEPKNKSQSIYDEYDPEVLLDLYGAEIPTTVDTWSTGPAVAVHRFLPSVFDSYSEESDGTI